MTKKTSLDVKIIYQIFAKPPPSRIPAYTTASDDESTLFKNQSLKLLDMQSFGFIFHINMHILS